NVLHEVSVHCGTVAGTWYVEPAVTIAWMSSTGPRQVVGGVTVGVCPIVMAAFAGATTSRQAAIEAIATRGATLGPMTCSFPGVGGSRLRIYPMPGPVATGSDRGRSEPGALDLLEHGRHRHRRVPPALAAAVVVGVMEQEDVAAAQPLGHL